jgi:hypothetical protein
MERPNPVKSPAPAPIFLLAAPHCYAALIGAMLGQHPETFDVPELNLFIADTLEGLWSEMPDAKQIQIHGLLRAAAYLFAGEQTITSILMARRWLTRRMHWPTSRVFDEIRAKAAPFRVVEKSRTSVRDADTLKRIGDACPDAFFVHLVRHPLSFGLAVSAGSGEAQSLVRGIGESGAQRRNVDPQLLWLGVERRIEEFLTMVPAERQIRLRVEDLFDAPEEQLRTLARAMQLSTSVPATEAMLHPERSPFAGLGPVGANLGDELSFLENPKFRAPRPVEVSLDGALPWARDGAGFGADVVERARELGYF